MWTILFHVFTASAAVLKRYSQPQWWCTAMGFPTWTLVRFNTNFIQLISTSSQICPASIEQLFDLLNKKSLYEIICSTFYNGLLRSHMNSCISFLITCSIWDPLWRWSRMFYNPLKTPDILGMTLYNMVLKRNSMDWKALQKRSKFYFI